MTTPALDERIRYFDTLFTDSPDPWRYRTSWYEARKRDVLLACLPQRRFARAFEPACANGELTLRLAARCDRLLASDASTAAVALARARVAAHPHVTVEHGVLPNGWPDGAFDLVVVSEIGYYLSADEWQRTLDRGVDALSADGTWIACHWRHPEGDYLRSGDEVHHLMRTRLGEHHAMTRLLRHEEDDFLVEAWSRDPRSVARREGLTG